MRLLIVLLMFLPISINANAWDIADSARVGTMGLVGSVWVSPGVQRDTLSSAIAVSAGVGFLWAQSQAITQGLPVVKSGWDGMMMGIAAPGILIGGVLGVSAGLLWHTVTWQPLSPAGMVGWGAAGAGIGQSVVSSMFAYDTLRQAMQIQEINPQGWPAIGIAIGWGYSGMALHDASGYVRQIAKRGLQDFDSHYAVSAYLRHRYDPGTALLIGYAKETQDYFLGTGRPEWRDLQNNWNGVFGIPEKF